MRKKPVKPATYIGPIERTRSPLLEVRTLDPLHVSRVQSLMDLILCARCGQPEPPTPALKHTDLNKPRRRSPRRKRR